METIKLPARYGYVHTLTHIKDNLWRFDSDPKSGGYSRLIGDEHGMDNITAFDPDGGPFLTVGSKIEDKTIKSISSNGILELE